MRLIYTLHDRRPNIRDAGVARSLTIKPYPHGCPLLDILCSAYHYDFFRVLSIGPD